MNRFHTSQPCCAKCGLPRARRHSHSTDGSPLVERELDMFPGSTLVANKNIGDGTLRGGVIHGRYQPAAALPQRLRVNAEELRDAYVPPSSFRSNSRLSRGGT